MPPPYRSPPGHPPGPPPGPPSGPMKNGTGGPYNAFNVSEPNIAGQGQFNGHNGYRDGDQDFAQEMDGKLSNS